MLANIIVKRKSQLELYRDLGSVDKESYYIHFSPDKVSGGNHYAFICQEYERFDVKLRLVNKDYSLCCTYPEFIPVPDNFEVAKLKAVAGFRSRGRLPVLSWKDIKTGASLWRCSQPKSAFNSCYEDEEMISQHLSEKTFILDARPFANAMANKLVGRGYEDTHSVYKNCEVSCLFV